MPSSRPSPAASTASAWRHLVCTSGSGNPSVVASVRRPPPTRRDRCSPPRVTPRPRRWRRWRRPHVGPAAHGPLDERAQACRVDSDAAPRATGAAAQPDERRATRPARRLPCAPGRRSTMAAASAGRSAPQRPLGETAVEQPVDATVAQPVRSARGPSPGVAGGVEVGRDRRRGARRRARRTMPASPVRLDAGEQGVGLVPPAELVAVPGGHPFEHAGQDAACQRRARRRRPACARSTNSPARPAVHNLAPQVAVDADGVGDVAALLGELEGAAELLQPGLTIAAAEQAGAERVAGVSLVGRRAGGDSGGDRPSGMRPRHAVTRPLEGVGVGRPAPVPWPRSAVGPAPARRRARRPPARRRRGRPGAGTSRGARGAARRGPARRRGSTDARAHLDELGGALDVAGTAGVVGGAVQQLVVGDRQLVGSSSPIGVVPRVEGDLPVALRLRPGVRRLGVRRPPRRRRAAPAPGGRRPTSGARAPARRSPSTSVRSALDGRGEGAVEARPLAGEQRRRRWRCAAGRGGTGSGRRRRRGCARARPRAGSESAPARTPSPTAASKRCPTRRPPTAATRSTPWVGGRQPIEPGQQQLVQADRQLAAAVAAAASSSTSNGLPSERSSTARTVSSSGRPSKMPSSWASRSAGPEPVEPDALDAVGAVQLGERAAQRVPAGQGVVAAIGGQHEQAGNRRPTCEAHEEVLRRPIRPVHVLEHEHHRRSAVSCRIASSSSSDGAPPCDGTLRRRAGRAPR